MTDPNQTGSRSTEDLMALLQQKAAEAGEHLQAAVDASAERLEDAEKAAVTGLAQLAKKVHGLPPQNRETLGPLWPGAERDS